MRSVYGTTANNRRRTQQTRCPLSTAAANYWRKHERLNGEEIARAFVYFYVHGKSVSASAALARLGGAPCQTN